MTTNFFLKIQKPCIDHFFWQSRLISAHLQNVHVLVHQGSTLENLHRPTGSSDSEDWMPGHANREPTVPWGHCPDSALSRLFQIFLALRRGRNLNAGGVDIPWQWFGLLSTCVQELPRCFFKNVNGKLSSMCSFICFLCSSPNTTSQWSKTMKRARHKRFCRNKAVDGQ